MNAIQSGPLSWCVQETAHSMCATDTLKCGTLHFQPNINAHITLKYLPKEFPWDKNSFYGMDPNFIWDRSDTHGQQPQSCSEWSCCVTCGPWVVTASAAISICMEWNSSRNVNTMIEHAVIFYWKSSIQSIQKTLPLKILSKPCRSFCLFTSFS